MSIKIENLVKQLGKKGKNACLLMSNISSYKKNKTLENISKIIEKNKNLILKANKIDLSNAKKNKLNSAKIDRLSLNEESSSYNLVYWIIWFWFSIVLYCLL